MNCGKFIISLDFEIYWGLRDAIKLDEYQNQLKGVRTAIPEMLRIFSKYNIQATFATVGLLFFDQKEQMIRALPCLKPSYSDKNLSPYYTIEEIGRSEVEDPFHFGLSLIKQIQKSGQEIGSHTFCHYYCQEPGQTKEQLDADIAAAVMTANTYNIQLRSFVFPRNQYNPEYLDLLKKYGFTCFRGNQKSIIFNYAQKGIVLLFTRLLRLVDSYINVTGHNDFEQKDLIESGVVNIPASRLLRPFNPKLKSLERMRLKRITASMTAAAKSGNVYHLWWHPHNFGINQKENFEFLEKILLHYKLLNKQYGFQSMSMKDFASQQM